MGEGGDHHLGEVNERGEESGFYEGVEERDSTHCDQLLEIYLWIMSFRVCRRWEGGSRKRYGK